MSAMPANASSCLSKADQAAKTRSNFDFLSMETCYKSLGLSSTQPTCVSLINTAAGLYNIDWDKEAFRKVVEYDSCRETVAAQPNPQPEPQPSNSSSKPVAPVVPVTPEKQKAVKCKAKPQSSLAKLVYGTGAREFSGAFYESYKDMGRWNTDGLRHWIGTDGYLGLRIHLKTSTSAVSFFNYEVKTSNSKGQWSSWRNGGGQSFGPIYPGQNQYLWYALDVSLGSIVRPSDVKQVRVRVQLGNDCGWPWQELTSSSGLSLFDPKRGKPSTLSCALPSSSYYYKSAGDLINVLGFGDECGDYSLANPTP